MYTAKKSEIAKLRAYRKELDDLYALALGRRDLRRAQELHGLRRRVQRAILLYEEWHPGELPSVSHQPSALEAVDELPRRLANG